MAFNFGAFIGGASDNLVEMIKTKEAQLYKEEQDEKERVRKARVAAANQRRADEKAANEAAQRLKLAGFDKDRISYALKQGTTYADGLAEYGAIAIANNKDPNTLLKYSSNIDEFKTLSGHRGFDQEIKLPEGFTLPEGADVTKYFEEDRETFTTLSQPASKPVTSLQAVRANVVNEMLKLDPTSTEYQALSAKNDRLLEEIKREHDNSDNKENEDPFDNSAVRNDWKVYLKDAATPLGMETLEGDIINVQAGNQGKAYIATIRAGLDMKERLKRGGFESQNVTSYADTKIAGAVSDLKQRGMRIVYSASELSDATKAALADGESPDRDLGLLEKFKMPFNPETQTYKSSYTGQEALALANQGAFDYGDVIVVDNIPVVFTGLKMSYANLSEGGSTPNVPFLYLTDDERFSVTDVGRYGSM